MTLRYDPDIDAGLRLVRIKDASLEQMEQSKKPFRLMMDVWYGEEVDEEQVLMMRHLQVTADAGSARWIGAISIRRYRDFVRDMFANDGQTRDGMGRHVIDSSRAVFNMAGVTHFAQAVGEGKVDTMEQHGFEIVGEELILNTKYRLYENQQVYPKTWLVNEVVGLNTVEEVLDRLGDQDVDLRKTMLIEGESEISSSGAADEVKIITYEPTRIELEVKKETAGWLVLADAYLPAWQATINGEAAEVVPANEVFRAVRVEPGESRVVFEYVSPATDLAIRLMVAAMLLGLLWWLISDEVDRALHLNK